MTIDREALRERLIKARETAGTCFTTLRNETADEVIAALDQPAQEPVAWTGSGSMMALKDGREGFIWPTSAEAHPIPLYAAPQPATLPDESR